MPNYNKRFNNIVVKAAVNADHLTKKSSMVEIIETAQYCAL